MFEFSTILLVIMFIFYPYYFIEKMYPHVKKGSEVLFWLQLWMFIPDILEEEGQEYRKQYFYTLPIFIVFGLLLTSIKS